VLVGFVKDFYLTSSIVYWIEESGMANPALQDIVSELRRFATTAKDLASLQEFTVGLFAARLPHYNWVGFYMLDPDDNGVLVLGPFHGAPTEHVRIPVTQGICGAAVAQGETVIVEDVSSDPRYLACSIETRSEIVVPIRANGSIIGEIDIDSHELNAFGEQDRSFLEECAAVIGRFLENLR
jgi:L-methionine (R)-S-oxide reductase